MFDFIGEMFSERKGTAFSHASMMRVLITFIIVVVMFNWTFFNIKAGKMLPLDWQMIIVIIGSLSAKAMQKKWEAKD